MSSQRTSRSARPRVRPRPEHRARVGRHLARTVAPMGIVDELLQHPGLYLGIDRDTDHRGEAAARILVTPLPGRAGVALDYETINPSNPERVRGHHEHALLARAHGGAAILVTAHSHADTIAVLRETD